MTTPAPTPRPDRRWYELSLRHLRMSSRLLRLGFPDGSCFHTYHAFECAVSAVIAAKGWPVPPKGRTRPSGSGRLVYTGPSGHMTDSSTHKIKLILFDQVADKSKPYYVTFSTLERMLPPMRNQTLYYDPARDLLPGQQFNQSQASGLYQQIRQFVKEVRPEIP